MSKVEVDENGLNKNIKAHLLSKKKMTEIGFVDVEDKWVFYKTWYDIDISFNVSIPKNAPKKLRIDVIDDLISQPYDYQYILSISPEAKVPNMVKKRVDRYMTYLIDNGVLSGWQVGDYL